MTLTINHSTNPMRFDPCFGCVTPYQIDINQAVKEKLNGEDVLTNALALKILKQIRFKSDVKSFFTKPIVLFVLSISSLVATLCIPVTSTFIFVVTIVLGGASGGAIGYSIENSLNGFLPALSKAYRDQSLQATDNIRKIEAAGGELNFVLPE